MPTWSPGAPGALPLLPLGMCWQLQDAPDYHLSWGRGQGRLKGVGAYCGPLNVELTLTLTLTMCRNRETCDAGSPRSGTRRDLTRGRLLSAVHLILVLCTRVASRVRV